MLNKFTPTKLGSFNTKAKIRTVYFAILAGKKSKKSDFLVHRAPLKKVSVSAVSASKKFRYRLPNIRPNSSAETSFGRSLKIIIHVIVPLGHGPGQV